MKLVPQMQDGSHRTGGPKPCGPFLCPGGSLGRDQGKMGDDLWSRPALRLAAGSLVLSQARLWGSCPPPTPIPRLTLAQPDASRTASPPKGLPAPHPRHLPQELHQVEDEPFLPEEAPCPVLGPAGQGELDRGWGWVPASSCLSGRGTGAGGREREQVGCVSLGGPHHPGPWPETHSCPAAGPGGRCWLPAPTAGWRLLLGSLGSEAGGKAGLSATA